MIRVLGRWQCASEGEKGETIYFLNGDADEALTMEKDKKKGTLKSAFHKVRQLVTTLWACT